MQELSRKILFLTPRVLGILFILFLGLFSLDVFEEGYGFWGTILAFLIHNIPAFVLLIVLILSWRWEWMGGVIFIGMGAFYIIYMWGKFPFVAYLTISGPAFLIGLLFWINWFVKIKDKNSKISNGVK
jgi:hypothetical protein